MYTFFIVKLYNTYIDKKQRYKNYMITNYYYKCPPELGYLEIQLDSFGKIRRAVFIDKAQNAAITQPNFDSSTKIKLTKYTNDEIEYESDAKSDQFAVFVDLYHAKTINIVLDRYPVESIAR